MPSSSSSSSSSSSEAEEPQDHQVPDTEWRDVEVDQEDDISFLCLFDDSRFATLHEMLKYCETQYDFDFKKVVDRFDLDFYGCIKLVNYIRSEVVRGNKKPDIGSRTAFDDEKYLRPVIDEDAVLFSLDEILEEKTLGGGVAAATTADDAVKGGLQEKSGDRINELEEQLRNLTRQFADYRVVVEQTLEQRWSERGATGAELSSKDATGARLPVRLGLEDDRGLKVKSRRDDDTYYFESYAYNDIHETMIRDTVRTDSYRDFIYDNKALFASKTVLDVGCGTGILSLFAAKAGAKRVYAVDNSNIIVKARRIIADNKLDNTIVCLQGKVEDIDLHPMPSSTTIDSSNTDTSSSPKVDILVSEWMGYGLLFESMLDSVIHARDRFLNPDTGIMAPSHCSLRIAPIADSEYLSESLSFWHQVYGFDYRAMSERMCDDILMRSVDPTDLAANATTFKWLDLYTIRSQDLQFNQVPFENVLTRDVPDGIQAWCIWFDTFFLTDRKLKLNQDAVAEHWPEIGHEDLGVAFTTGPNGTETHWKSALCVIDRLKKKKKTTMMNNGVGLHKEVDASNGDLQNGQEQYGNQFQMDTAEYQKDSRSQDEDYQYTQPVPLKRGQTVKGTVAYRRGASSSRDIEIEIEWNVPGTDERGCQVWLLR